MGPLRQPRARGDHRSRRPLRDRWEQQRDAEQREKHDRRDPPVLVGPDGPRAADGRKGRHSRERDRHPGKQRQAAPHERLVGSRKDEGEHRQDARAEDSQHAAEKGEDEEGHLVAFSSFTPCPA